MSHIGSPRCKAVTHVLVAQTMSKSIRCWKKGSRAIGEGYGGENVVIAGRELCPVHARQLLQDKRG